MNGARLATSLATIVVVPRERFSYSIKSLDSILEHTPAGVPLIYIDAGTPRRLNAELVRRARASRFRHLRSEGFLTPNQARNWGARLVNTKYIVFVDNDVLVSPGWFDALVRCAEETSADLVGPLYLEGEPSNAVIHMAGGSVQLKHDGGRTRLSIYMRHSGERPAKVVAGLKREPTQNIEFHCALARTATLESLGYLDEGFECTREHVDLCLSVEKLGGSIVFEPGSVVAYVTPREMDFHDLRYYLFRWAHDKAERSLAHFEGKWQVPVESYRLSLLERRRRGALIRFAAKPLARLGVGRVNAWIDRAVLRFGLERV